MFLNKLSQTLFFSKINLTIFVTILIVLLNPFSQVKDIKKSEYSFSTLNIDSSNTWSKVLQENGANFIIHPGENKPSILLINFNKTTDLKLNFDIDLPQEVLNNPKSGIVEINLKSQEGNTSFIVDRDYNKTINIKSNFIQIEIDKGEYSWSDSTKIHLSKGANYSLVKQGVLLIFLYLIIWSVPTLIKRFYSEDQIKYLSKVKPELAGLLTFITLIIVFLPSKYCYGDVGAWQKWGIYIFHHGITEVYNTDCNYHPFYLYGIQMFTYILGSETAINENINYIKLIPFFFDLIPVIILLFYSKKLNPNRISLYWLLLNIGYLYNSIFWGQVDSIYSNMALVSIILILEGKISWGFICYIIAINTKLQAIIFLPIIGLILIRKRNLGFLTFGKATCVAALFQIILILPFIITEKVQELTNTVLSAINFFPMVSLSAYNLWYLVLSSNPMETMDSIQFLGISYKNWGTLLFLLFSTITLLPLLIHSIFNKSKVNFNELTFLSLGVISLVFFYFNTQMHERYSHPALIFFFFYALQSRRKDLFLITSFAYVLNLERVLKYFDINHGTLLFNSKFIATLFGIVLLLGIIRLYKNFGLYNFYKQLNPSKTGINSEPN